MQRTKLKTFACVARTKIKTGVVRRLLTLGFTAKGEPTVFPRQIQGATMFGGQQLEPAFYNQWTALSEAIRLRGVQAVYEEAAYTWFNRFMAIRILQKNDFIDRVLSFDDPEIRIPHIVSEARSGRLPELSPREQLRLRAIIGDATRTLDQFRLLIVAFCHTTPLLHRAFGQLCDYTELLLPDDILDEGGFIDMLNRSDFITDEDYHTTELLGWLYQFYISERKDEVFASFKKSHKAEADDIPAATQIFTPRWIVRYMVENTLGRTYLAANPDSPLRQKMTYLVETDSGDTAPTALEDLRVIDPACGSGHILLVAFDLLFDIYAAEYYDPRTAVEQIFTRNLLGIDLDTRARQLSMFALMLRAAQRDSSLAAEPIVPRVLDMALSHSQEGNYRDYLSHFFLGGTAQQIDETSEALRLCEQARNLGSIMRFSLSDDTRRAIAEAVDRWTRDPVPAHTEMLPTFRLILALTDRYTCIVANPPYMGSGNMNAELAKYVKDNYEDGKADLFSVFMLVGMRLLSDGGRLGMINMQSWMFLSSFEKLRKQFLKRYHIDSMLHLGPRTFDELSGEVVQNTAFVISNAAPATDAAGTYFRLVSGKDCADKERLFLTEPITRYDHVPQSNFEKIPGSPIGYWVSEKELNSFSISLKEYSRPRLGQNTGDNDRFLRLWYEIEKGDINFELKKGQNSGASIWIPYTKGGVSRKWYGHSNTIIYWANNGSAVKDYCTIRNGGKHWSRYIQSLDYFYAEGIAFPRIGSNSFNARYITSGTIYDVNAPACFNANINLVMAYLNSSVAKLYLSIICPSLTFQVGDISKLPFVEPNKSTSDTISNIVRRNISISRSDWDAHETSWDFKENELVRIYKDNGWGPLDIVLSEYKQVWGHLFNELHRNEEELNRQFISIYGLEDELTPDVPLEEVTILQQGEVSIENGRMVWHDDVIVKQLLSYAVGCIMGRYRLDRPGLAIAHPAPTEAELAPYEVNGMRFEIDDDAIVPLMPQESAFADNAAERITDVVRTAFGADHLTENLNTIEAALGKSIAEYMQRDFWRDHKRRYQNRPIYWLFRSRRGAFQCLVYMHRMDAYTVQKVRTGYLLKHLDWLLSRQADLMARQATLTAEERRRLTAIGREIDECREYDTRLHAAANQHLTFDLDDGVIVNHAKFGDILEKIK